jgi:RecA-family ATPase
MDMELLPRFAASDFARLVLPERITFLDPILSSKSLALLYGPRGLGKTFVALGIAWAAAAGASFLG